MNVERMKKVKILFTDATGKVTRVVIDLPDPVYRVKFLQFRGKLYQNKGSGMSANFFHEVENFMVVSGDTKNYSRSEFLRAN